MVSLNTLLTLPPTQLFDFMANNSIATGTRIRHANPKHRVFDGAHYQLVSTGTVVAQSKLGEENVIVEWDSPYPVSTEHVDDLIEIK